MKFRLVLDQIRECIYDKENKQKGLLVKLLVNLTRTEEGARKFLRAGEVYIHCVLFFNLFITYFRIWRVWIF